MPQLLHELIGDLIVAKAMNIAGDQAISAQVRPDVKANPIIDERTKVPRRRKIDDIIDLIEYLDGDALRLNNEED